MAFSFLARRPVSVSVLVLGQLAVYAHSMWHLKAISHISKL